MAESLPTVGVIRGYMDFTQASLEDGNSLAEIRAAAMKPSLEALL